MCSGYSVDDISHSNLVHRMHVVDDVDDHVGLYGRQGTLFKLFYFPQPPRLAEKSITKGTRIPVFRTVAKAQMAMLTQEYQRLEIFF